VRRRGNHRQLQHPHRPGTVTVAGEPSYMLPVATYRSILRQSGLDRESEG
jgi:predicted RNA binding protein YcfA (HicA-like mRNA interferase family)